MGIFFGGRLNLRYVFWYTVIPDVFLVNCYTLDPK